MTSQAQRECNRYPGENYFGACPECGGHDGYRNIGKAHWFFCRRHKTRWDIGSNLFSSWRDETEAQQREHAAFFYVECYRKVEPIYPEPPRLSRLTRWLLDMRLRLRLPAMPNNEEIPF